MTLRNICICIGLIWLGLSSSWTLYSRSAESTMTSKGSFASVEAVSAWMSSYYRHPEPDRLGDALRMLSTAGMLTDPPKAMMVSGFFAGLIAADAGNLDKITAQVAKGSIDQQQLVVVAVALAGRRDLLPVLTSSLPAMQGRIDRILTDKQAMHLLRMAIDRRPELLDAHWAYFMATGHEEPLLRIMSTLEGISQDDDLHRIMTSYSAKWSLASNARQHAKVMEICRREAAARSEPIAGLLREVVAAAEANDARRIRREGEAAVRAWKERQERNKS